MATERERYELPPALAASAAGRGRSGFEDGFEPTDSAAVPSKGREQTPMCQHPRCEWEAGHYPAGPTGHSESGRDRTWECGDPYSGIGCPEPHCTHDPQGYPENATMFERPWGQPQASDHARDAT